MFPPTKGQGPEASFSDDQTKLTWHLGQVGPTKFDSFKKGKNLLLGNRLAFWSKLTQMPLKLCLGTEKPASGLRQSRELNYRTRLSYQA